jgi:hypothetical protein
MTPGPDDRSIRLARWWVRRYTAGLPDVARVSRRAEITSDLVEHARCREADDWTSSRIMRERLGRLVRGAFADLSWRHELISGESQVRGFVRVSVASVASIATVALAVFHFAFAAYLLGGTSLAERRFLGGIDGYAEEVGRPVASVMAALIIAVLGLVLLLAVLARPVSPLVANAVTVAISTVAIMFFWLGVWPVGIVAVVGSCLDLAIRTPNLTRQP